jgi:hypothetical protein
MPRDPPSSPEEVFSALGNQVRIEILRSFLEADRSGDGVLSFTEIYDTLQIKSTSQLSYHLDRLDGPFLQKTDDGYALTLAGDRIVRAILSGTYSEKPHFDPIRIEGVCAECGPTTLRAEHRNVDLVVCCPTCESPVVTYDLLPAEIVDRTSIEVLKSCDRRVHQAYATALRGTCSLCGGKTDIEITEATADRPVDVDCLIQCRRCHYPVHAPLSVSLCYHPEVITFYWERGLNILEVPFWRIHEYLDEWAIEVTGTEPLRAHVAAGFAGDELSLSIDEGLDVSQLRSERSLAFD